MILKELRLSKQLSQEQLARMSGLSVRTIQRIERGENASLESKKCLAAALEVDIATLEQDVFRHEDNRKNWSQLPMFLKLWFGFHYLQFHPSRKVATRAEWLSHISGFVFCFLGLVNEAALVGGLMMLSSAYLFTALKWQGDKYAIWFDTFD
ncbi:hypothetical protein PALB_24650 [Pseudoalteromonas luteoviolacea B = ATCC 29581]|nr:hypothetical protein PALB_24650 [Pseudoalteromonas luteoviolacea B = ATCC 29581]